MAAAAAAETNHRMVVVPYPYRSTQRKPFVMARHYQINASDSAEVESIRLMLREIREDNGETHQQVAARLGKEPDFIFDRENRRRDSPHLSSLQLWASAFDLRLEVNINNFWMHAWNEPEMQALYAMSRPFDAAPMLRLWTVSALGCWRRRLGISAREAGVRMGLSPDAVTRWELESHDPLVNRMMVQARATGTWITFRLWHRDDWIFG